jgi:hypothetical protein
MQTREHRPEVMPVISNIPSPPRPPWWRSMPGQMALSAGVFVILLFARRPETFLNPQFWAEDGPVFFVQADGLGARALTSPSAGYHHLLLRLIAALSSPLSAQLVPAAYVGLSLAVLLGLVLALFSPRINLPARPACALAIVLIPHSGEAIGNLTNLQWVCGLGLVWLLIARDGSTMREHVTDGMGALVLGLTGAFSTLFAPLFAWRAWRRRTPTSIVLATLVAVGAGVQLWTIAHSPPPPTGRENFTAEMVALWLGFRLPAAMFLPANWAIRTPRGMLEVMGVLTVATLLVTAFLPGRHRERRLLLVAALVAVIAATIFRARHELTAFAGLNNGDRYLFIPKVLVAWLLISGWSQPSWIRWTTLTASGLILLTTTTHWRYERLPDRHWPDYARRIEAGEPVQGITVNPGLTFTHPGRHRE